MLTMWLAVLIALSAIHQHPVQATSPLVKSVGGGGMQTVFQCPGPYMMNSPWYPDDDDCGCYFVCRISGHAVRMCCPDGLWWHHDSKTCMYLQDFSDNHQERCQSLQRGVGTTKQLKEIFLGRCWEYQRFVYPSGFKEGYRDCEVLFESFAQTFVNKAPCGDVKPGDYERLIGQATVALPPDSQIFWSGTYGLAQEYAAHGRRGFTLEMTLIGYILNDVTWCGAVVAPGINFESCPAFASCPNHVMASFWAKALEFYAAQAQGVVTVILNGSRTDGPAFRNNSFFAEHELPNLNPDKVTMVRAWVAHDLDRPTAETCNSGGSLLTLRKLVETRGFSFHCQDNPLTVLHLLCAYMTSDPQCYYRGLRKLKQHQTYDRATPPYRSQPSNSQGQDFDSEATPYGQQTDSELSTVEDMNPDPDTAAPDTEVNPDVGENSIQDTDPDSP